MPRLSNGDLTKILDAVAILNSSAGVETLAERTINCVSSLVPNEMTAFDGFDDEGFYDGSLWYSPPDTVPPERIRLFGELIHEHPYFSEAVQTQNQNILRTSDFLPLREFHKTKLFNEFYRTFDGECQMGIAFRLSQYSIITCNVLRPRVDFTDREAEILRIVGPHLSAAFKTALSLDQIGRTNRHLSRVVTKGLVVLDGKGRITYESEIARSLISSYFGKSGALGLPTQLRAYVEAVVSAAESPNQYRPAEDLSVSNGKNALRVTAAISAAEKEVLIFLEQSETHKVADFKKAGMTEREAEVLYWVSQGKTDAVVARILSISPRTVQKHVEHIFDKLGVETRTGAVTQALRESR